MLVAFLLLLSALAYLWWPDFTGFLNLIDSYSWLAEESIFAVILYFESKSWFLNELSFPVPGIVESCELIWFWPWAFKLIYLTRALGSIFSLWLTPMLNGLSLLTSLPFFGLAAPDDCYDLFITPLVFKGDAFCCSVSHFFLSDFSMDFSLSLMSWAAFLS